ncbi:hypothetical protein Clacol_008553 [Clathrus columnatus]|uniref:Uncharacterized protein n=1 Tax=Clathrus columnatus TaxID=1419009 RepID=A0AAV5ANP5_9AGAM|nr:hypothetical protein Clacol_008553 [Clathrus columnatus]
MYLRTWFTFILSVFLSSAGAAPAAFDLSSLLNLVTQINVFISLETLTTNLATSNAGVNGTVFATFSHTFNPPLVIGIGQTVNSGNITNVDLVQGALNSLGIIPGGVLDLNSNVVAFEIIPIDGLTQNNVPTRLKAKTPFGAEIPWRYRYPCESVIS